MSRRRGTWRTGKATRVICCFGIIGLMGGVAAAHPPDEPAGSLDSAFGNGGVVLTPAQDAFSPAGVVIQEDGKIVTGGITLASNSFVFTLFRYNRDGTLDPTFGVGGTVTTPGSGTSLVGLVGQRDGKIVAAGNVGAADGSEMIVLARYRHDGQLDAEFGTNGLVFTDFGAGSVTRAAAVALQPDNRIVVVGVTAASPTSGFSRNMLVRYERNGSLDGTFGVGGRVSTSFGGLGEILNAVAIADDGKIVVAGDGKGFSVGGFVSTVARFNSDGSMDATFGSGGAVVLTQLGSPSGLGAVAVQHDGRITVAGGAPANLQGPPTTGIIARFEADGTFDATFGVGGLFFFPLLASGSSAVGPITIDRCGRIVGAGVLAGSPGALAVFRFERDGSPDPAFGTEGVVTTTIDGLTLGADALALTHDGDIVVTGLATPQDPFSASFLVARYEEGSDHGHRCGCGERRFH